MIASWPISTVGSAHPISTSTPATRQASQSHRSRRAPGIIEEVILALETSCDETAAALVSQDGEIRANVVASQADLHARYGGVVPEVASRRHLELLLPVLREVQAEANATLDDVDRVAVTTGPGLIGALLVGLSAAKALACACRSSPSTTSTAMSHPSTCSRTRWSRHSSACSRAAGTPSCSTSVTTPATAGWA